jgi:hypothetical protein
MAGNGKKLTGTDKDPYDLSEESSRRGNDEEATELARREESDDMGRGQSDLPHDSGNENRVTTSLSED